KQGINDHLTGNYENAIDKIKNSLPALLENEDFAWASIGEFYIGKSWWERGDADQAIDYFKKVDQVFDTRGYTHPDLREAYELLITYYKKQDDKENQLRYIEKLVSVDSVYNRNHKYLINQLFKKYTTFEL